MIGNETSLLVGYLHVRKRRLSKLLDTMTKLAEDDLNLGEFNHPSIRVILPFKHHIKPLKNDFLSDMQEVSKHNREVKKASEIQEYSEVPRLSSQIKLKNCKVLEAVLTKFGERNPFYRLHYDGKYTGNNLADNFIVYFGKAIIRELGTTSLAWIDLEELADRGFRKDLIRPLAGCPYDFNNGRIFFDLRQDLILRYDLEGHWYRNLDLIISPPSSIKDVAFLLHIITDKYCGLVMRYQGEDNSGKERVNYYLQLYRHKTKRRLIFHRFMDLPDAPRNCKIVPMNKKRDLLIVQVGDSLIFMIWIIENSTILGPRKLDLHFDPGRDFEVSKMDDGFIYCLGPARLEVFIEFRLKDFDCPSE